jgi:hypothetical protein
MKAEKKNNFRDVRLEVFMAVTMKKAVFWDVAPCRSRVNRRFGGTYRLHLQGRKIHERGTSVTGVCSHLLILVPRSRIFLPWRWRRYVLRNVGLHKIYTAPHSRRRRSSISKIFIPCVKDNCAMYPVIFVLRYQVTHFGLKVCISMTLFTKFCDMLSFPILSLF